MLGKILPAFKQSNSPLVQSVERRTVNPYVASSSLAGGAKFKKKAQLKDWAFFVYLPHPEMYLYIEDEWWQLQITPTINQTQDIYYIQGRSTVLLGKESTKS